MIVAQDALLAAEEGNHKGERVVGAELVAEVATARAMRMHALLHLSAHRADPISLNDDQSAAVVGQVRCGRADHADKYTPHAHWLLTCLGSSILCARLIQ